ncbi:hypothetical protein DBR44_12865 [Aquitalea sp. FJL05]|nr:hypothetical protein DBR44_12865 [Aquitalea sp. FJL05]
MGRWQTGRKDAIKQLYYLFTRQRQGRSWQPCARRMGRLVPEQRPVYLAGADGVVLLAAAAKWPVLATVNSSVFQAGPKQDSALNIINKAANNYPAGATAAILFFSSKTMIARQIINGSAN